MLMQALEVIAGILIALLFCAAALAVSWWFWDLVDRLTGRRRD
jgi:hypothetical protein